MILEEGNKVLIFHRRLYASDRSRLFIGKVDAYEGGIARVTGHTWMEDFKMAKYVEKDGLRTKIFAIASGTLMVYLIPKDVELSMLAFEEGQDGRKWLTDGIEYKIDLTESEPPRFT